MALRASVSDRWCDYNASVPPQALWWAPYSPLPVGALTFFVYFHQDLGEHVRWAVQKLRKVEPPNDVFRDPWKGQEQGEKQESA